jgi:hypothetical protein
LNRERVRRARELTVRIKDAHSKSVGRPREPLEDELRELGALMEQMTEEERREAASG